jgi:hypothetical protein
MTHRTRIIVIIATIFALSFAVGVKQLADDDHIPGEIGTATSTIATPISEIEEVKAPTKKILPLPIVKDETDPEDRAEKIDRYFESKGMPLAGRGAEFVRSADLYSIDWRILAAISVVESTGGKQMCGNNPFGWGSCRSGVGDFASIEEAIDYVSKNLGGANPRTRSAYAGGVDEDLHSYNGTVDPTYPQKVKDIMSEISRTPLSPTP